MITFKSLQEVIDRSPIEQLLVKLKGCSQAIENIDTRNTNIIESLQTALRNLAQDYTTICSTLLQNNERIGIEINNSEETSSNRYELSADSAVTMEAREMDSIENYRIVLLCTFKYPMVASEAIAQLTTETLSGTEEGLQEFLDEFYTSIKTSFRQTTEDQMIELMSHELVHVLQIYRAPKNKTSGLHVDLDDIDSINRDMYAAIPEEIGAYASELAGSMFRKGFHSKELYDSNALRRFLDQHHSNTIMKDYYLDSIAGTRLHNQFWKQVYLSLKQLETSS